MTILSKAIYVKGDSSDEEDFDKKIDSLNTFLASNKNKNDNEEETIGYNHNKKKYRRKADILARTLSRTIRGVQDSDTPTTCDICLEDYEVGDEVAWSKNGQCIHAFHKDCIVDWLLRSPKCPLCRNEYIITNFEHNDPDDGELFTRTFLDYRHRRSISSITSYET